MATLVDATCSECFLPQVIELNPRRMEIACEFCSHSVPMFEKRDMDGIRSALRQEWSKALIALAAFGGAVALFVLYVLTNSYSDMVEVTTADGVQRGYLEERTDSYVVVIDETSGEPISVEFKTAMADKVREKMAQIPLVTEAAAARMVGHESIKVVRQEAGPPIFLVLAAVAGLASLVLSAVATQDRLVCEF